MDGLTVVLRFVHVVGGILWAGLFAFTFLFLTPAVQALGPDGGKVVAALQRRGLMIVMPVVALLTIGSGLWLMQRSPVGRLPGFLVGGAAALIAFLLGLIVLRPLMEKVATATDPAEGQRLRARSVTVTRWVAVFMFIAVVAMAVARYI